VNQVLAGLQESLARPTAPPAPHVIIPPFGPRVVVGMVGVLIAVMMSGINDHVTDIDMMDIQGGLLVGHDEGAWMRALFQAGQVIGMAFAPWCAVTFSLRRFCLVMTAALALLGLAFPFVTEVGSLYALRATQGLVGGFLPPLLITVALRYCPPSIRLFGFSGYALSSTFGPNMATPLAAWWSDYAGWPWIFWHIIPFCAVSLAAVTYGLPQDPLRLDRFRSFDWFGLFTGAPAIGALVIAAHQGDRLNWFESPLFCVLLIGGGLLFCLFLLNEWFHPAPIFKLQILARRNFLFSVLAVTGLLILYLGVIVVPLTFLGEVKGYRPLDVTTLALIIALPQLVLLPLVAAVLNYEQLDWRWVFVTGLALIAWSCYLASSLTSEWIADNFYFILALQALGQPMTILPLLMVVVADMPAADGPHVSSMFNATKGFAAVLITTLVEGYGRFRTEFHSSVMVGHLGQDPTAYEQRLQTFDHQLVGLVGDEGTRTEMSLHMLAEQVRAQSVTLAMADIYWVLLALTLALIVMTFTLPTHVRPPRAS
jgi:MFS transporter, DHA2 family, multidrug resistance protein